MFHVLMLHALSRHRMIDDDGNLVRSFGTQGAGRQTGMQNVCDTTIFTNFAEAIASVLRLCDAHVERVRHRWQMSQGRI